MNEYENKVTVIRDRCTVTLSENEADIEDVYGACRSAVLGLGFHINSVNEWFPDAD